MEELKKEEEKFVGVPMGRCHIGRHTVQWGEVEKKGHWWVF